MRKRLVLAASALVLALVAGACGAVTPYAAKVNGARISTDTLDAELEAIRGNKQYLEAVDSQLALQGRRVLGEGKGTFSTSFVSQVLSRRILLELVHQEVVRRKLRVTADELRTARSQLEESFGDPQMVARFPKRFIDELVLRTAEVTKLQQALASGNVGDDEVREFYEQNATFFEQTCARHILVGGFPPAAAVPAEEDARAQAAAEAIVRRLGAGDDFAAIARAESQDPETAPQGGDLGCRQSTEFPAVVYGKLSELQPGQVGGPVRGDQGWHVVQLVERRQQPLEEAAPRIREFLESQGENALEEFIRSAVADADITVNPRYGRFDKEQLSVVPPQAPTTSVPADERGPAGEGESESELPQPPQDQ